MTVEADIRFFTRRAKHEAALILTTPDPAAKAAHEHLGAAYRGRIIMLNYARRKGSTKALGR